MRLIQIFVGLSLLLVGSAVAAGDVHVDGYYRDDGTYVEPHVRSSPDNLTSNNYGPSQSESELMNPEQRDFDNDGMSNMNDLDSDADGVGDNYDSNVYGD